MIQIDMFQETLDKKIYRMEKWIVRLQRELYFLREVHNLSRNRMVPMYNPNKNEQLDIFCPYEDTNSATQ